MWKPTTCTPCLLINVLITPKVDKPQRCQFSAQKKKKQPTFPSNTGHFTESTWSTVPVLSTKSPCNLLRSCPGWVKFVAGFCLLNSGLTLTRVHKGCKPNYFLPSFPVALSLVMRGLCNGGQLGEHLSPTWHLCFIDVLFNILQKRISWSFFHLQSIFHGWPKVALR